MIGHSRYTLRYIALITLFLSACQAAFPSVTSSPVQVTFVPILSSPSPTPTQLSAPEVRWTFQTEGAVWGTATVNNGIVYIGSDDGNLYAIDANTGNLKWKFPTEGLVRSHPAILNNLVFITSDDGYLYGIDTQSSEQVWKVDIGNLSDPEPRENPGVVPDPTIFDFIQSSPIVSGGHIFIGSADGKVFAVEAKTGDFIWTYQTGQKIRATPAVEGDVVYVGSWDGIVYALSASTGRGLWQTPIGGQVQSTSLVTNGLVYTASRKASVVALEAATGKVRWEYSYGKNMWVESSPQLAGDLLFIGSSGNRNVVGLNAQSGELYTNFPGLNFFWSTPFIDNALLYIGAEAFISDGGTGGLCSFEIPTKIDYENRGMIKLRWIFPVKETLMPDGNWAGVVSSPVIDRGLIFFGGLDGMVYALSEVQ